MALGERFMALEVTCIPGLPASSMGLEVVSSGRLTKELRGHRKPLSQKVSERSGPLSLSPLWALCAPKALEAFGRVTQAGSPYHTATVEGVAVWQRYTGALSWA